MRLFIALDLPADVRAGLSAWARQASPPEVRPVPAGNLHVTLAFLGARGGDDAAAVRALLPELARPLQELCTTGALWLPTRHPGVLAVAVADAPALVALQVDLARALAAAIGFAPERRRFRPHVTVGRVRRETRIDTRAALQPPAPELRFAVRRMTLYRSRVTSEGARYERLGGTVLS